MDEEVKEYMGECLMTHKFSKKTGDLFLCMVCGLVVNPEKLMELTK